MSAKSVKIAKLPKPANWLKNPLNLLNRYELNLQHLQYSTGDVGQDTGYVRQET